MDLNITFKRLITFFFRGIIYIVPIVATGFILTKVFLLVDGILPFEIPGLGIVVIVVFLTFLGYIGNLIIAQPFVNFIENTINKAPVINGIYSAIKDILSAFVGKDKKFNQPVLVKVNNISNLEKIGFITRENLTEVGIPTNKIAVYFPHSYAFSGELYIVPAEFITPIDKNSTDVMKFIVSGGVVNM